MKVKVRSAGVIPVRRDPDGWRLLVLRAYRNWDFPKGVVEEGDDLLETAKREAKEEADLDDLRFEWGDASVDTAPYGRGKVATYFLAATDRTDVVLPVSPELGRPEHHEGRWVSLDEAQALLPDRLQPVLAWVGEVLTTSGEGP